MNNFMSIKWINSESLCPNYSLFGNQKQTNKKARSDCLENQKTKFRNSVGFGEQLNNCNFKMFNSSLWLKFPSISKLNDCNFIIASCQQIKFKTSNSTTGIILTRVFLPTLSLAKRFISTKHLRVLCMY